MNNVCAICAASAVPCFDKDGYRILECPACGHRFADIPDVAGHVDRVYGDDYFTGGGAGYPDYLGEQSLLRARGAWYARRIRPHVAPGRMLDVGAAAGFVLRGFMDEGWSGSGIEVNAAMARYAREELGVEVQQTSLEELKTDGQFDLICMIQVLAHLHDLPAALANAAGRTRPGGWWLIETWDRSSLTARLFGRSWHEYSPPSVIHYFTRDGVRRLAARFGFEPIAEGRPMKRIGGAHARSLLTHAAPGAIGKRIAGWVGRLIPERAALPYPSEDLFWMLLRKSESSAAQSDP